MRNRGLGVLMGWTLVFWGVGLAGVGLAASPAPSPREDEGPVVTPDPTPPPAAKAAPSGSVGVTAEAPAAEGYVIPIAGAPFASLRPGAAAAPKAAKPPAAMVAPRQRSAVSGPAPPAGAPRTTVRPSPKTLKPPRPVNAPARATLKRTKAPSRPAAPLAAAASADPVADGAAQADAPVLARAKLCIAGHVGEVARVEASPVEAVELLVRDVCAQSVAAASLYLRNVADLAAFNAQSERGQAGLTQAEVDPQTGRLINPPDVDALPGQAGSDAEAKGPLPPASDLREYAALRLLAEKARLADGGARTH